MQAYISRPLDAARRYWRMSLIRGVIAVLFGLMAIFWPHLTFKLFFIVFGVFAIIEGCLLIASAFSQKKAVSQEKEAYQRENPYQRGDAYRGEASYQRDTSYQRDETYQRDPAHQSDFDARPTNWILLLGEGVLGVILGLLCIFLPSTMGTVAVYVVAAWAFIEGVSALMQMQTRGWVMGVIGILAIILALILFFNPVAVIRSFLWVVGVFALITGVLMIVWGFYQNSRASRQERPLEPA